MHPLIAGRRSARGYDPAATISAAELTAILEAGRWAPTWGGIQPVRFIVGRRDDETFVALAAALRRGNSWAKASSALILLCTNDSDDDERLRDYGLVDAGLAAGQLILQANALGFNAHPMAGFDADRLVESFGIPTDRRPIAVVAIGRLADPELVDDEIAERDRQPRHRLPLTEVAFTESWGTPFE